MPPDPSRTAGLLRLHALFLALLIGGRGSPVLAEPHPFSVHDLLACKRISDPRVSPDGREVVFVLRTTDLEANRGRTDLWSVAVAGSEPRRLTSHPDADTSPCWSPDGRWICFLSRRGGSSQVWRLPVGGGEAEQVTSLPLDVEALQLSPDGSRLAVGVKVFPGTTLEETARRLAERAASPRTGQVYDALLIRHWDEWKDGRRNHVFVLPAPFGAVNGAAATAPPIDIMSAMDADCPTRPFGGAEDFTFTPDGREIVFSARDAGTSEAWSTNFDLFAAPVDGSSPPRRLTSDNPAWDAHPLFSPDGRTLAWLAMQRPDYEADRFRIMLREWPQGPPRELASDWDRSPRDLAWSPDGRTVYATAEHLGQTGLFAIDVSSGAVRTLVDTVGTVSDIEITGARVVFGLDHFSSPVELYTMNLTGGEPQAITHINEPVLADVRMGTAGRFTFAGWNGEEVFGFIVHPAEMVEGRKYPVALLIHGGPQGSFGNHWHYRWNPQTYAGRGYAAVMIDFHGSTGYGQAFTDSIRGDWGGKPLVDLQKGLAAALQNYPTLDAERVAALGASYGGFMIYWIAGNWPDRFRCLVSHDGVFNTHMAYFSTEELWFPEWDHLGTPWDQPEVYQRNNPIFHVDKWQTPMLVIHGALDYRVVDIDGLSAFTALQRRGIPSKLLYFPDENHWVLKPHNSIQWHETVLDWLDQWCKK